MQTTFLNAAGIVLFTRDDMEQGNWSQEEYTVNATFPYDAGKVIERGQRLWFRDPATNNPEAFEIKNVTNIEPEHYQQIIAEHIAVSELTDDHINTKEITNQTPQQALTAALAGTLWSVGTVDATNISSADISRGSVWQAVCAIAQNWNVHITPRLTVNATGAITNRYLDIAQATGVWRGLRLSVDKNMSDSSVTYDDSETLTALYGYGGSVGTASGSGDDTTEELTFANVEWTATSEHPAKPMGQKYIEDPAKTALYGRNGRARFGYYQNSGITDHAILLQKTWEALKATSSPKISIYGTATDLYRLGYEDQPIRLHDLAIVDVRETGERFRLQIIKADIDLLDPTATTVEIGAYIPNIIYINRDTNESATSTNYTSVGSGGRRGQSNKQYKESETYSALEKTDNMIGMVVGTRNGQNYIKAGEIGLAINKSGETGQYESTAYINADHINISATKDVHTLAGDIAHDANGRLIIKNAGGMYVEHTEAGTTSYFGVWDKGNLTGGVMVQQINGQEGTKLTLKANVVDIPGVVSELAAYDVGVSSFSCAGQAEITGTLYCDADIQAAYGMFGSVTISPEESEDVFTLNVYDAALSQDGKTLTIYKIDGDPITFNPLISVDEKIEIRAKEIEVYADEKIEIRAKSIESYADQIDERLSDAIGEVKINTDSLQEEWTLYKGTEIYKNKEHIDQVCGLYKVVETKDPDTGEVIDRKLIVTAGTGLYQTRDGVALGVYDNGNLTGGIMAQKINGQTETLINGDRVKIDGKTTVNDVITITEAGVASFGRNVVFLDKNSNTSINGGKVSANTVSIKENGSLDFVIGHGESAAPMSITGSILSSMIQSFEIKDNVLTLTRMNGTSETFSKAVTLSVEYGGDAETDTATFTVTGTPAKNFPSGNTTVGTFTVHQNKLAAYILDGAGTLRARIDNPQYSNGWSAAYGKVDLPTTSSTAQSFTIETPPSTVDGEAEQTTYTMNNAQKNVATVTNPVGTVVARLAHNRYNGGWSAAYGKVDLPTTSSTATSFTIETPPSTVDGNADSTTYTMNNAQKNVATVTNPSGTVVARLEHNRYNDGWDGCVATKTWVGDASKTLSYGEAVTVSASIKDKNNKTVSIGAATYVAPDYATPYNAGGATAWVESVGAVANPEQLTPGTYIAPSYVKYGASSATVKDHKWYVPTAWLAAADSAPAGTEFEGELAYDTIYYVRYQKSDRSWDNKWEGKYWKTPIDKGGEKHTNSMGITRAVAYRNTSGNYEYYGKMYYYDAKTNKYVPSNSDHYWYYSNVNLSGSNTVWY